MEFWGSTAVTERVVLGYYEASGWVVGVASFSKFLKFLSLFRGGLGWNDAAKGVEVFERR